MIKIKSSKIKFSARITPHNYEMVRAIADLFFRDEGAKEGNFSEALDWVLTNDRLWSEKAPHFRHWIYKFRYESGDRSYETIEGMKRYEAHLLKVSNE